jgi:hypothetical protein
MTMPASANGRGKSLWRRLIDRLFGKRRRAAVTFPPDPAASAAPLTPIDVCADAGELLTIPALGEVFDFQVQIEATWSAAVSDYATLRLCADRQAESVRRAVLEKIWPLGRDHAPHLAGDAERAMSRALPEEFCFSGADGVTLRCKPRLRVRPDPRVLEHLLPHGKRGLDLDALHGLGEQRAAHVEALTQMWRTVLANLTGANLGDLVLGHAATLADTEFAKVVTTLEAHRSRSRLELAQVLDQAAQNHRSFGLFEFAEAYEVARKAFVRSMGVPDPLPPAEGAS